MDGMNIDKETLDAIIAYGRQLKTSGEPVTSEKIHYVAMPNENGGCRIESLEKFQFPQGQPPERIKANPTFQDATSFCDYLKDFRDPRLRVFADANRCVFFAVLDYHDPDEPQFCQHTASWPMTLSPQWSTWIGQHDKLIPQEAFAEFLEDNIKDIIEPDPATILEVARDLSAHTEVTFESKIVSKSGTVQLRYSENLKTTGAMEVPDKFTIKIPVFFGEPALEIECRLRFRISGGKLSFIFKLYRPVEVKMDAFKAAVASVSGMLELEVHLGVCG